ICSINHLIIHSFPTRRSSDLKIITSEFNNVFFESIMKSNQKLLDNPELYDGIRNDGVIFELDFVKNDNVFSTDNYLILEKVDNNKILKILKIIKQHTTLKTNKDYIENISFYLE